MAATIDERIVEMKFDNGEFEKHAEQTMSTLERLKNALNFDNTKNSLNSIEKASKEVTLNDLAESISAIENRFSVMGIVGMTALQNLTNSALNLGKTLITAIPRQITQGGWSRAMNVADAKFQLKGLGVAWEDVADDIDHAVMGTRYGADVAAKAASQLAASGVKYGGVIETLADGTEVYSDMGRALRGISGTAAMTNSEFEDISRIFTTIAGQGKVMTLQLNQLSMRGLNVAADLGKVLGKSEGEIREMVTKGKIDFQTFADAMDQLYGEHATKADETFNGAKANMKSALSRIGQDFAQTILAETPKVFVAIKEFFNKIRTFTQPIANEVFTPTFVASTKIAAAAIKRITNMIPKVSTAAQIKAAKDAGQDVSNWIDVAELKASDAFQAIRYAASGVTNVISALLMIVRPLKNAFHEVFNTSISYKIYYLARVFNQFTQKLLMSESAAEDFAKIFRGVFSVLKLILTIATNVLKIFSPFANTILTVAMAVLKIAGILGDFVAKITGAVNASEALYKIFNTLYFITDFLATALSFVVSKITELGASFIVVMGSRFLSFLSDVIDKFVKWATAAGIVRKALLTIGAIVAIPVIAIAGLTVGIATLIKKIYELQVVQKALSALSSTLRSIGAFIVNTVSMIVVSIQRLIQSLRQFNLTTFLNNIKTGLTNILTAIKNFISSFKGGNEIIQNISKTMNKFLEMLQNLKNMIVNGNIIEQFTKPMQTASGETITFKDRILKVAKAIKEFILNIDIAKVAIVSYAIMITSLLMSLNKAVNAFTKLATSASGALNSVKTFFNSWKRKELSKIEQTSKAIFTIAAALAMLARLPFEDLWRAAVVMGAVTLALVGVNFAFVALAKSLTKAKAAESYENLVKGLMALSVAFVTLAAGVKLLESVDLTFDLAKTALFTVGLVSILMMVATSLSKVGGKNTIKAIGMLVSFGVALVGMAGALTILSRIDYTNISDNIKPLLAVIGMLSILAVAASQIGIFSAAGLIITVYSLTKIVDPLKQFISMVDMDKVHAALEKYKDVIIQLGVIAAAMIGIAGIFGKGVRRFASGMILMSVSFVILAGAIKVLAAIPENDVNKGVSVIERVYTLYAILALFMSIGKGQNAMGISVAIGVLTMSLYGISGAIFILGSLNPAKVSQGTKAVSALLACFALVVGAASLGNGKVGVGTILALSLGLILIIGELLVLTVIPIKQVITATLAMSAVLMAFSKVLKALTYFGKFEKMAKGSFRVMFTLIGVIGAIGFGLAEVANHSWGKIFTAGRAMSAVMKQLTKTLEVIGKMSKNQNFKINESVIDTLGALAIIVAAIGGIMGVAIAFGGDWQEFLSFGIAINIVLKQITKIIKELGSLQAVKKGYVKILEGVALVIAAIGGSMALAAKFGGKWYDFITIGIAMRLVLNSISWIITSLKTLEDIPKGTIGTFLSLSAIILAIGGSLAIAATQPWNRILAAAIAIDLVLIPINSLIKRLGKIASKDGLPDGAAPLMGSLSLIILTLGIALTNMAAYDWRQLMGAALSMDAALLAISVIFLTIDKLNKDGGGVGAVAKSIGSVVLMVLLLAGVAAGLVALMYFNSQFGGMLEAVQAMMTVLVGIGAIVAVMALIGPAAFVGALVGVGSILSFVFTIVGVFGKLGELLNKLNSSEFINNINTGIETLTQIGNKLAQGFGEFIGTLLGSLGTSLGTYLPGIADGLSDFVNKMEPFTEGIKKFDDDSVKGSIKLAECLAVLAGGQLLQGLASLTGNDMKSMSEGLTQFGEGLSGFGNATSNINANHMQISSDAAKTLMEAFAGLALSGTLEKVVGSITGSTNFEGLEENLTSFGKALVGFVETTSSISAASVEGGCAAATAIASMLSSLPNEGGLIGMIMGENSIQQFTEERMRSFAQGLVAFAEEAAKITDASGIDNAIAVATAVFALKPPNEGGWLGKVLGENSFDLFNADKMTKFAGGLSAFANNVKTIDSSGVETACSIARTIFALKPPNEGGWLADVFGDNSFDKFDSERLGKFGSGIGAFANAVSTVSSSAVTHAQYAAALIEEVFEGKLADKIDKITKNKGLFGNREVTESAEKLSTTLTTLGGGINNFVTSLSSVGSGSITNATALLGSVVDMLSGMSSINASSVVKFQEVMAKNATLGIDKFVEAFTSADSASKLNTGIETTYNTIGTSMTTYSTILTTASQNVMQAVYDAATSAEIMIQMESIGDAVMSAFSRGVEAQYANVFQTGKGAVKILTDGMTEGVSEYGQVAFNAGEAITASGEFVEGVESALPNVKEAGETVVETASTGMKDAATGIWGKVSQTAGSILGEDVISGAKSKLGDMYQMGSQYAEQFKNGTLDIKSVLQQLKDKMVETGVEGNALFAGLQQLYSGITGTEEGFGDLFSQLTGGTDTADSFSDSLDDVSESLGGVGGAAGKAKNEVEDFNDSLLKSLESKTGGMSFFSKLEMKAETSAEAILENMKSNIDGITKWTSGLQTLMERGLDKGLVKVLADAGLESYDQINAFLNMSDEQMAQANQMFLDANALRADSAKSITDGYYALGKDNMQGLVNGMANQQSSVNNEVTTIATGALEAAQDEFGTHSPSRKFNAIGEFNMLGLRQGMDNYSKYVFSISESIAERIIEIFETALSADKAKSMGANYTLGLAEGLSDSTAMGKLMSAAETVASLISETTARVNEIESPSKVAYRQGMYYDIGLANGMLAYGNAVESAAENVGNLTSKSLQTMTQNINDAMGEMDTTVRPILDLSLLKQQAASISGIIDSNSNFEMSWSNPAVRGKFMDDMISKIGTEYADKVVDAINNKDNTANVYLEGDAAGVFKVVRQENRRFIKRTGYNGLA